VLILTIYRLSIAARSIGWVEQNPPFGSIRPSAFVGVTQNMPWGVEARMFLGLVRPTPFFNCASVCDLKPIA
jgi:hypothetical protein